MEGCRAARRVVQGGGMRRVSLCHHARYQAPEGCLLRLAAGSGMLQPVNPSAGDCAAGSKMRGVRWRSGRKHVRQVRDGRGIAQVHVDPQEGGSRGARLAVREGLPALDASLQCLLLRAPARGRGWLVPGARSHLGAPRAPVGARWRGGGHRAALPAEVAGVWEVGGRGPGIEAAKPEVVPPLAKGAPEFQQAGADTAPVVSTKCFLPDRLPRVVGEYAVVGKGRYEVIPRQAGMLLEGRHIGVTPGEVGHKSVSPAPVCGALVEEGQQGAVGDRLPAHSQPAAALQLPAQRGGEVGGEHEEQVSWNVAQPEQGVIVGRPPFFEMRHGEPGAPVLWREPPDGGCVASPFVYLLGSEHVGGVGQEVGGVGCSEERGQIASAPGIGVPGEPAAILVAAASHGRSEPAP